MGKRSRSAIDALRASLESEIPPHGLNDPELRGLLQAAQEVEEFTQVAMTVDADRIWTLIEPNLDSADAPWSGGRPGGRLSRLFRKLIVAVRSLARRANITDAGWGGPTAVSLFAIAVVIALAS